MTAARTHCECSAGDRFESERAALERPAVSVCLPVFNGENFLREAIASVFDQTFQDFELVISDNASTDGTGDICREAECRDRRVRYFRSETNCGLARNFNRAFGLARGRYLVWLGHDDVMGKDYLRQCVAALEADPGAVLCFSNADYIDDSGSTLLDRALNNPGAAETGSERLLRILFGICDPI
jgi:glycosyltransferase involved in cell wall biosynthesis